MNGLTPFNVLLLIVGALLIYAGMTTRTPQQVLQDVLAGNPSGETKTFTQSESLRKKLQSVKKKP